MNKPPVRAREGSDLYIDESRMLLDGTMRAKRQKGLLRYINKRWRHKLKLQLEKTDEL